MQSGSSYTYTLSESTIGAITYYGGAFIGGEGINGSSYNCVVVITAPVDHPGTITITPNPLTIQLGQSVAFSGLYQDSDGTVQVKVFQGMQTIGTRSCSGTSCSYYGITDTPTTTGTLTYTAQGKDAYSNLTVGTTTVTVTGPILPQIPYFNPQPNPTTVGTSVSFSVTATDAGSNVTSITTYYGDGGSNTQTCTSGGSCSKAFTHPYTTSGAFQSYAVATDSLGHTGQSATVIVNVASPADTDGDGVPDASDQCPNTPTYWRPVVTSGIYLGCACQEIVNIIPNPVADTNACTDDTCSINGQGYFVAVHTPKQNYAQPEGMSDGCQGTTYHDYYCYGGAVVDNATPNSIQCGGCTLNFTQVCWNNAGYWQDSCSNLQQPPLVNCTTGQTCHVIAGVASCTGCTPDCVGKACGASDGCGATCSGTCAAGVCMFNTTAGAYQCIVTCTPTCAGKVCGDDGCGGSCGTCTTGTCNATGQCVASCTPSCAGKVCGGDGCGGSCGTCDTGMMCNAAYQCVLNQVFLQPVPSSVTVTAGFSFSIWYNVTPDDPDLLLVRDGWPSGASIDQATRTLGYAPGNADVGPHSLTVTVKHRITGQQWAQATVPVIVACNQADAVVGACCDSNGAYLPESAACAYNSSETGSCTAAHSCVRVCHQNVAERCNGNAVTYVDSCGAWGDVVDDCDLSNRTCVEQAGGASCVAQPPTCAGDYRYECRGNDGVAIDQSCGKVTTTVQCTSGQVCEASPTGVSCRDKGPCDDVPGTISCDIRCVDPLTSRSDCGGCGIDCKRTEQCVQGSCEPIPGCNVVCDSNQQCGPNEVCIFAGDCTQSQCQAINVVDQNRSTIENLTQALLQQGLVRVAMTIRGPVITYTVTNLGPSPVENLTLTSTLGKVITEDASTLTVSGVDYVILKNDPVLQFRISELATTKTFTVTANHMLDESYLNLIQNELSYNNTGDLLDAWNRTKDALTIGINSDYNGNETTFHLTLNPSKSLGGVSVPLEIPKCLAQKAAELKLSGNYHVIQDDPLIVWQFDKLSEPTEITFSVPKDIDEECKATI